MENRVRPGGHFVVRRERASLEVVHVFDRDPHGVLCPCEHPLRREDQGLLDVEVRIAPDGVAEFARRTRHRPETARRDEAGRDPHGSILGGAGQKKVS